MNGSTSVLLLLLAAAGVAIAHSVLPDHWVPIAVVARVNRWSLIHTARSSFLASVGHVGVSIGLGLVVAAVGLAFRQTVEQQQGHIVGVVLVITGVGFLIWSLVPRHSHEHDHTDEHEANESHAHHHRSGGWMARVAVPFGVAASPDLTILPVFLAASAVGVGAALGVLIVFSGVTFATFVGLTVIATIGGYQVEWPWLEEHGYVVSALVLIAIGVVAYVGL